jgi:CPA2 family monovalent cation:H+ antiporter-2
MRLPIESYQTGVDGQVALAPTGARKAAFDERTSDRPETFTGSVAPRHLLCFFDRTVHDAHHFLVNLALVLGVAAITTVIFQRLRQPVVLGYLLAGAIVSPHTPLPLFADDDMIHALAELGVILLMFSLGLEFSLRRLIQVGPSAGVVAVIQCTLMLWLGYVVGQLFGWTRMESLYTGALIAISSTTIIVKAFEEQQVRGPLTQIVFGILIIEDLIAIFLLAVLTTLSKGDELTAGGLLSTTGTLAAFLAVTLGGGLLIVPRLMRAIVRLERPETTVVASIGLCFGCALLASEAGYSVALGAFLGGALVAESGTGKTVEHLIEPVRDVFAAIFFIAVGMLINPAVLAEHWAAILAITVVVVLGKLVGVAVGVFLAGRDVRTAVQAGMSLAQIGEFSFIIAAVGLSTGATGAFLYPIAVAVSAFTTLLTPWLIRASSPTAIYIDARLPHSIQTFAALYGSWLEEIRTRPREPSVGRTLRRMVRRIAVDGACLAAIVIATAVWGGDAASAVRERAPIADHFTWVAVLVAAVALALPFCIGLVRSTAALAQDLATAAFPRTVDRTDLADAPRRVLVVAIQLGILLAVGVPLVTVTQPFLPPGPSAAVLIALLIMAGLALLRSAGNLQAHSRAGAEAIVEVLAAQLHTPTPQAEQASEVQALQRLLPGLGAPVPVRVHAGTRAVGHTLGQINLRGLTGATVLAIVRDNSDSVLIPTGRETLEAGDILAVAGTSDAVSRAEQLLAEPAGAAVA